jgi:hypothetical protein
MNEPVPAGRFSLGDFRLQLDPAIQAEIQALQAGRPAPRLRQLILQPPWSRIQQDRLDRILSQPPPPGAPPLVPRGAGPRTARAAEVGDLMNALWAVPAMRQTAEGLMGRLTLRLRQGWDRAPIGERAVVVSSAAAMSGLALAGVLSNDEARNRAFQLIVGRDIPVPGVDGLSVRFRPRGGQFTASDIAGTGVTVRAGAQQSAGGQMQYDVMLTLDVTRYLPGF